MERGAHLLQGGAFYFRSPLQRRLQLVTGSKIQDLRTADTLTGGPEEVHACTLH